MGKYFKYALGEILLVVIGILIALWINNLNTQNQQQKEKDVLLVSLEQELTENLNEFNSRINDLNRVNNNLIKVMNFSAGKNNAIQIDSLKQYLKEALIFPALALNNSRLNSAKSSGKFNLLSQDVASSLTEYEALLQNYLDFIAETTQVFNDDWSNLVIRLNTLNEFHRIKYPDTRIITHPNLNLNDQELIPFLNQPDTYKILHSYYVKFMIETIWLEQSAAKIESSLAIIKEDQSD